MTDIEGSLVSESFARELRDALNHLYDWVRLRTSPLLAAFGLDQKEDPPTALRRVLVSAIESLKPGPQVPPRAKAWRAYQLLYARYIEQLTQMETAADLGLSIRHLRREETLAVETLAAYLQDHHNLESRWREPEDVLPLTEVGILPPDIQTPSRAQELDWLEESLPHEPMDVDEVTRAVLNLLRPLAQASDVEIDYQSADGLPLSIAQRTPMRQALLTMGTMAIRGVTGGQVAIKTEVSDSKIRIGIEATGHPVSTTIAKDKVERLEVARRLIDLSGGSLETTQLEGSEQPFRAAITLPAMEQVPVLVIDDNEDTLQLLQRYLSNSRYHFSGTSDPAQAVHLASKLAPRIIVLDVMLPGIDGWELLGRLHEHPQLRDVPIIVCSIVPQEQLAAALGAADFVPKPVSRGAFLSTLNKHCEPLRKGSR